MLSNNNKVLKEVRKILQKDSISQIEVVPLSLISKLIVMMNQKLEKIINSYEIKLNKLVKEQFDNNIECVLYEFDYRFNTLIVGIRLNFKEDFKRVMFRKENNKLYVFKNELDGLYDQKLLKFLEDYLLELYNKYMDFSDFKKQSNYNITVPNSLFKVDITSIGIRLYIPSSSNKFNSLISIESDDFEEKININCKNIDILKEIEGLESELYNKVYVSLDDCPPWSKGILKQTRKNQLINSLIVESKNNELNKKTNH